MRFRISVLLLMILPTLVIGQDGPISSTRAAIDSLIQLNRAALAKRQLAGAQEVILQAMEMAESIRTSAPETYARCLFNAGRTNHILENFREAEQQYLEAIDMQRTEKAVNPEDLAGSLNALAYLYSLLGRYDDSERLYFEALNIRHKTLGESHPDYATSLSNIGDLYTQKGDYKQAESYILKARDLREQVIGKDHPDYTWSLNNLGVLYKKMGRYEQAEDLFIQTRDRRLQANGPKHLLYGISMNNLANLYVEMERYQEAETLYKETLQIWKEALGPTHSYVANTLNNLSELYKRNGQYPESRALIEEAIDIWENQYGRDNLQYANGKNNLGLVFEKMGQYPQALEAIKEARDIRLRTLDRNHPDIGNSDNGLGQLYWTMGLPDQADTLLREAALVQKRMVSQAVRFLTEQEQTEYATRFVENLDLYYSYLQDYGTRHPNDVAIGLDLTLFHKGFVLHASQQLRNRVQQIPQVRTMYQDLQIMRKKLSSEYAKPVQDRRDISDLEQDADELEKKITLVIGEENSLSEEVSWKDLQTKLGPEDGLVEFVHFRYRHPRETDSIYYGAFILRKDSPMPIFVPLFEEQEISPLLETQGERRADYVNQLYAYADRGFVSTETPQKTLYELIWQPLQEAKGGITGLKRIYFSMSGLLHRVNLGAIPLSDETSLADAIQFVQLGSTRQLMESNRQAPTVGDAAVFGGIQYDLDSLTIALAREHDDQDLLASRGEQVMAAMDQSLKQGAWSYLKWTKKESETVQSVIQAAGIPVQEFDGLTATEEAFHALGHQQKGSPGIIHLATHGYFFPDPADLPADTRREVVFQLSAKPMIRSGLILSGGNYVWGGGQPLPGREDGILTSYEISQLDLSQTELVVLSACETGLGDIRGNEGVYGLQRAFKIAGVRYLIMSLWQVPDRETMQFMTTFYGHWLGEGKPIPEAFRQTQREMRDRFYNPYSWAGFILLD
ncbi:MAG: CHAT domain-containing protein [Lewinellaceae bacterium]|nr:CHAT domain-containing protein [Saprospiraceae bacterium]MCB9312934.1 CHAT domain-containing protein [Lewinellaceae bacterium]